jgi:Flp pilus assembly protein TadD
LPREMGLQPKYALVCRAGSGNTFRVTETDTRALVVLGMHRSGTSALAGMLAAAGVAEAGPAVRNWDNARGHFEALALVRLNETVLARSGGHWLAAPAEVRWTAEDERERERLLTERVAGRAPLLKDPRTLLVLPFWRASGVPFHALGIVRHPLAVARSLASWRAVPLATGLALWTAHNRMLLADVERLGFPLVDFDAPAEAVVTAVARACERLGLAAERTRLAAAFDEPLVHHDADEEASLEGLDEVLALHAKLLARAGSSGPRAMRRPFPRAAMADLERCVAARDLARAARAVREALERADDAAAVLVPAVASLLRAQGFAEARALLVEARARLEPSLAELLLGKLELAAGDARAAVPHLEAARAAPEPYFQAHRLLPHALRAAGRRAEARRALGELAGLALYPHDPLSQLAECAWYDGEPEAALAHMAAAIAAAPKHRRGRMRTRRAAWLAERGARAEAERELVLAVEEDPTYPRSRRALAELRGSPGGE